MSESLDVINETLDEIQNDLIKSDKKQRELLQIKNYKKPKISKEHKNNYMKEWRKKQKTHFQELEKIAEEQQSLKEDDHQPSFGDTLLVNDDAISTISPEKTNLIIKIHHWFSCFPDLLQKQLGFNHKISSLSDMSFKDLQDLDLLIRSTLSGYNMRDNAKSMLTVSSVMAEKITCAPKVREKLDLLGLKLRLENFSAVLQQEGPMQENILNPLLIACIENNKYNINPYYQAMFSFIYCALQITAINIAQEKLKNNQKSDNSTESTLPNQSKTEQLTTQKLVHKTLDEIRNNVNEI